MRRQRPGRRTVEAELEAAVSQGHHHLEAVGQGRCFLRPRGSLPPCSRLQHRGQQSPPVPQVCGPGTPAHYPRSGSGKVCCCGNSAAIANTAVGGQRVVAAGVWGPGQRNPRTPQRDGQWPDRPVRTPRVSGAERCRRKACPLSPALATEVWRPRSSREGTAAPEGGEGG